MKVVTMIMLMGLSAPVQTGRYKKGMSTSLAWLSVIVSFSKNSIWSISLIEVKCILNFLGSETNCQLNSIHAVLEFNVTNSIYVTRVLG